jgi:hypothetical protein
MKIFYRISDNSYKKTKPEYVNNEACLRNFCNVFADYITDFVMIGDSINSETEEMIYKYIDKNQVEITNFGNGAESFNYCLDKALLYADEEIIYFIEDDYIHLNGSPEILLEGFNVPISHYVTLYDHPDKYKNKNQGGNPYIELNSELTRVFITKSCHWKLTNSTTMTFAAKVKTLKEDLKIIKNGHMEHIHMILICF